MSTVGDFEDDMKSSTVQADSTSSSNSGEEKFIVESSPEASKRKKADIKEEKMSNVYIMWSLVAALFMAFTSYVRTIASDTPYSSFFVLSMSYLIVSTVALIVAKCRIRENFHMSWAKKVVTSEDEAASSYQEINKSKEASNPAEQKETWRFSKF